MVPQEKKVGVAVLGGSVAKGLQYNETSIFFCNKP